MGQKFKAYLCAAGGILLAGLLGHIPGAQIAIVKLVADGIVAISGIYIGAQGASDILTKGKTSSVARQKPPEAPQVSTDTAKPPSPAGGPMKRSWLILALLLCAVAAQAQAPLTRGDIVYLVRHQIDDFDSAGTAQYKWSTGTILTVLNNVEIATTRTGKCLLGTTYYTTVTNVSTYPVYTSMLNIERASYYISGSTNAYKSLERKTLWNMDKFSGYWESLGGGLPERYYVWGDVINLNPKVGSSNDGENFLKVEYVVAPSSMTADNSVPFNGVPYMYPYHMALVWGTSYFFLKTDGKDAKADAALGSYRLILSQMIDELYDKPDWKPSMTLKLE